MANLLYDKFKQALLDGTAPNLVSANIRAILADAADYVVNIATDEFFDDFTVAGRIGDSGGTTLADGALLGTKTVVDGVFDADDATLTTVTGDQAEAIVVYWHNTVDGDSLLIAYMDTATGLPVTPSGGDITFQWDAAGIFAL